MTENRWSEPIAAFVVGLGVGAALGIFFAPRAGEDTREFLRSGAEDTLDAVAAGGRRLSRRVQRTIEKAGDQVQGAASEGAKAFQDAKKASA